MNGNGNHPTDDLLERYVFAPKSIRAVEELEAHLRECVRCGEQVALIRDFEAELPNPETWEVADAIAFSKTAPDWMLHELQSARREDAEAKELLDPVIGSPAAFLRSGIQTDPKYRTAGVVRRLVAASEAAREDRPRHALALADAAIAIAEELPATAYHANVLASVRGQAWRERANALRYLGRYLEVLRAVDEAERTFKNAPVAEFDLARLDFIRGTALWKMERYDSALPLARSARDVFRRYGDVRREVHAGLLEGGILFDSAQFAPSLDCFLTLLPLAAGTRIARSRGDVLPPRAAVLRAPRHGNREAPHHLEHRQTPHPARECLRRDSAPQGGRGRFREQGQPE